MEAQNCCSGCGIAESTQHLFFECPLFSIGIYGKRFQIFTEKEEYQPLKALTELTTLKNNDKAF